MLMGLALFAFKDLGMRLENRVAIITGAGRGIGRYIALGFAREGARLVLAARTTIQLAETAEQAKALGARTLVITTDVSNQSQVDSMVQQTLEEFGTIDILINNAGAIGSMGTVEKIDPSDWIQTINTNLIGTYLCCRAVLPAMLRQNRGKIINVSGGGASDNSLKYFSAYSSSKAAILKLTEVLSLEVADKNIQVNAVAPGAHHTQLTEELVSSMRDTGDSDYHKMVQELFSEEGPLEQLLELAVFLGSEDSGELSGRVISFNDFSPEFQAKIPEIMASDAYKVRRVKP